MHDPWRQQGEAQAGEPAQMRRSGPGWLTWLLFGLLLLVAWPWLPIGRSVLPLPGELQRLQQPGAGLPAVVAPTGALLDAFELARPATLRIEARCPTSPGGRRVMGVGSGFFYQADGRVLTAYHVLDEANSSSACAAVYVGVDADRREYPLAMVGFDHYMDLAVLQAEVDGLVPYIPLAARAPTPGTQVVAIGNSRGDFLEARAGRVTRLGVRAGRADFADGTIELTNALAPGDSGGPVVNARGEAVGVVSYISFNPGGMSSETYVPPFLLGLPLPREFAAYAIPVERGSTLVEALAAGTRRDVPVVGFNWSPGQDYDPRQSDMDLGPRPGPIVNTVSPGGPADRAGLRSQELRPLFDDSGRQMGQELIADVIVAIDGQATPTFYDLLAVVRSKSIGQTITLTVQRGGATYRLTLELAARRDVFANNP